MGGSGCNPSSVLPAFLLLTTRERNIHHPFRIMNSRGQCKHCQFLQVSGTWESVKGWAEKTENEADAEIDGIERRLEAELQSQLSDARIDRSAADDPECWRSEVSVWIRELRMVQGVEELRTKFK